MSRTSRLPARRLLSLIVSGCELRGVQAAAHRLCLNKRRLPREEVIPAVVRGVEAYYREHWVEAALAARQARTYQRIHFRHRLQKLREEDSGRESGDRGGPATHRRELQEHFLSEARQLGALREPFDVISYLSRYYAQDMVAAFDPAFFIAFRALAKRLFPNFVRSIRVEECVPGVIRALRGLVGREPVFFLPNHVSNADHVPVCFALNRLGILQPLIAAGANLFRGLSAEILPRMNAYKIRREEIGAESRWFYQVKWFHNPVYRKVHTEYLHYVWDRNEPFLFYVEGTRSRTGLLGRPKLGVLGDLLEYVRRASRTVHLVPVSLSYTVVPEDVEIEASRRGDNISDRDLIAQLAALDRDLGALRPTPIYVRFGEPLAVGPGGGNDAGALGAKIVGALGTELRPTDTSLAAAALLQVAGERPAEVWLREEEISSRMAVHAGAASASGGEDLVRRVETALSVFERRGFIVRAGDGLLRVESEPLIRQYANRLAHPVAAEPS